MFDELLVRVGLRITKQYTYYWDPLEPLYTLNIHWYKLSISYQNVQYKFLIRYVYVQLIMNTLRIRTKLKK